MSMTPAETNPAPSPLPGQAVAAIEPSPPERVYVVLRARIGGNRDIEGIYTDESDASRVAKRLSEHEFARTARFRATVQYTYSVTAEPLWPSEAVAASPSREALLEAALAGLLDVLGDACRLDHDGNCQAHFIEAPCRVAAARALLDLPPPGDDAAAPEAGPQAGVSAVSPVDPSDAIAEDCRWWEAVAPAGHSLHGWTDRQSAQFRSPEPFARIIQMDGAVATHIHALMGRQGAAA